MWAYSLGTVCNVSKDNSFICFITKPQRWHYAYNWHKIAYCVWLRKSLYDKNMLCFFVSSNPYIDVVFLSEKFQQVHKQFPMTVNLKQVALTVKSFNFVGTKFSGLMTMNMFMDTWICGFQIILNITKVNKYFVGILNLWIVLPPEYMKFNVQRIKMISQYLRRKVEPAHQQARVAHL